MYINYIILSETLLRRIKLMTNLFEFILSFQYLSKFEFGKQLSKF
jgi:hypothetical protein